jgi:hypothetical protein
MTIDAADRNDAIGKFRAGMTQQALDEHMSQYHQPGEPKPTLQQAHEMIGQTVKAAA